MLSEELNSCAKSTSGCVFTFASEGGSKPTRVIKIVTEKQPNTAYLGVASGHATYFVACPVSKNATSTLPLGDLEVITNSDGQTVVSP